MKFALLSTIALTAMAAVLSPRTDNPKAGPTISAADRTTVQISLSKILGAFVIGASRNQEDIQYLCKTDSLYTDWTAFTSPDASAALRTQLCVAAAGPLPAIPTLIGLIQQSTSVIFTHQLVSSFAPVLEIPVKVIWQTLCKNLDYDLLNAFGVVTTFSDPIASVCQLGGLGAQAYDPNTPALVANQSLVDGYQTTTMMLTARTIFLAASTKENREYICDRYDSYKPFIAGAGWDVHHFYHELCESLAFDSHLSDLSTVVQIFSSWDYGKQLRGVSKMEKQAWKTWLIKVLMPHNMAYVSLDAASVKQVLGNDIP